MKKFFFKTFTRNTGQNSYLAFIDGIRFLAIFMVVMFHLQPVFETNFGDYQSGFVNEFIQPISLNGGRGVDIFFVLSAFILGLNEISFKNKTGINQPVGVFYKKRFLRIYPPFLIAMILIFVGNVWVTNQFEFNELVPAFLSTITYTNKIADYFIDLPVFSLVTWTLEIEIQFYLLFPFLRLIFNLPVFKRRVLLLSGIPIFTYLQIELVNFPTTIFSFFSYFLAGLFLADIYDVSKTKSNLQELLFCLSSVICFICIFYFDYEGILASNLYLFIIGAFFYFSFNNKFSLSFLEYSLVSILGGMCYSIYLMHSSVISFFNNFLENHLSFAFNSGVFMWYAVNILFVLIVSIIFYVLIERPFMSMKLRNKPDSDKIIT